MEVDRLCFAITVCANSLLYAVSLSAQRWSGVKCATLTVAQFVMPPAALDDDEPKSVSQSTDPLAVVREASEPKSLLQSASAAATVVLEPEPKSVLQSTGVSVVVVAVLVDADEVLLVDALEASESAVTVPTTEESLAEAAGVTVGVATEVVVAALVVPA